MKASQEEFENILLAELQELRRTEKSLEKMYPRLKSKPQLRQRFLEQLADMQQRAYRLDAVLNPTASIA
jgi:ferritin-like metal-binding protein YciE